MSDCWLSVVIPTLNEQELIVALLQSLQPLRQAGAELILADGGSDDATVVLARPWVDHCVQSGPGRARQMNAAATVARGTWYWFVHVDTELPNDLVRALQSLRESRQRWGFCCIRLTGDEWYFRLIARMMTIRSRCSAVATGDQCLFVQAELFRELGGYEEIALMEDVALCKRLREVGRPLLLESTVISSSRRWRERGVIKTVVLMWALRLAYWLGVSPARLVKYYYG
jgi:rSAM/selenodomain-associated transferase 2